MDFKISNGPWTLLFEGVMQGHETELYANPKSIILAIVYETEKGKRKGALIECYKTFLSKGNLESFIETLPRRALSIVKHSKKETFKFLLIDSGAAYALYEEDAFIKETDALMAKIESFSSLVQEVSTAYDIDLLELENCTDKEKLAFFSIPLVGLLISPAVKRKEETLRIELGHGEILFGVTKRGTIVKEPFDFFDRTVISGGNKNDRLHVFHVLIESALLSNIPAIVIDWDNVFSGLHFPNEEIEELKKFKVDIEPIGFPIKFFKLGRELKADLNFIDPKSFLDAFGLLDKPQGVIIEQALAMGKSSDIFQLIDRVNKLPETEHITPFKKREAVRILMLIEGIYPKLFTGTNPIKEISGGWVRGIGRANILLLERGDPRKNLLVLQSIIGGLLQQVRSMGRSERLKALLFLCEGDNVIPLFKAGIVNKKMASDISQLREYGIGFIIELKDKVNIAKEVKARVQCYLTIINRNDVGVIVKNRKNYRVLLRPGLSKCSEKKTEEAKALTQVKL